jgi:GT2 family glycosyltransferase
MKQSIASVTVTRNRLETLKIVIDSLRRSTQKVDEIIVVNNGSSDGTAEWLAEQQGLTVINQGNEGSSGGEYAGMKLAFEHNHDWIWLVEDDIIPKDDCLEILLLSANENKICAPLPFNKDGSVFNHFAISYNLTNPFSSFWKQLMTTDDIKKVCFDAVGITFEGPLIHRHVVESIGLPDKDFFIYADDTEYFIRAAKYGFQIEVLTKARCTRQFERASTDTFDWRYYYFIRNIILIDVLHGNFAVRALRPIFFLFKWLAKVRNPKNIPTVLKAFADGYFHKKSML